jgi:Rod binding domain-containing protein
MLSIAGSTAATAGAEPISSSLAPQPRLVHAAQEFEGQMMKELLKPMTGANGLDGEDEDSGSGSELREFASEALGQALSKQGGFGIAASIVRQLSPKGTLPVTAQVTGNPHRNTVMKTYK